MGYICGPCMYLESEVRSRVKVRKRDGVESALHYARVMGPGMLRDDGDGRDDDGLVVGSGPEHGVAIRDPCYRARCEWCSVLHPHDIW